MFFSPLLCLLSTDDLPGVAGAGLPKDLKLRRVRPRPLPAPPLATNIAWGGGKKFRAAAAV